MAVDEPEEDEKPWGDGEGLRNPGMGNARLGLSWCETLAAPAHYAHPSSNPASLVVSSWCVSHVLTSPHGLLLMEVWMD